MTKLKDEKKEEVKPDLSDHQKLGLDIYKQLINAFPTTNMDRISIIVDLLKIEMRALSFVKIKGEQLENLGLKLMEEIQQGLKAVWDEDKPHRDKKNEEAAQNENTN